MVFLKAIQAELIQTLFLLPKSHVLFSGALETLLFVNYAGSGYVTALLHPATTLAAGMAV